MPRYQYYRGRPGGTIGLYELRRLVKMIPDRIDYLERQGKFPMRVKVGPNKVGWFWDEVQRWIKKNKEPPPENRLIFEVDDEAENT